MWAAIRGAALGESGGTSPSVHSALLLPSRDPQSVRSPDLAAKGDYLQDECIAMETTYSEIQMSALVASITAKPTNRT